MEILEPYNLPFAVAIGVLLFLTVLQLVGVGDFFDLDTGIDMDVNVDTDFDMSTDTGAVGGMVSLLGIGRVPFLIWLTCFLGLFSAGGLAIQAVAISQTGQPFPPLLVAGMVAAAALPLNGLLVRPLGAILPNDETTSVGLDSLVRRDATISIGAAQAGRPARASVKDRYGHTHHVMVEPHDRDVVLMEGETVLLVRREGLTFYAIQYENPHLQL